MSVRIDEESVPDAIDLLDPVIGHHVVNTLGWPALRPLQAEAVAPCSPAGTPYSWPPRRAARDILLGEDPPVRLTGRAKARLAEAREAHLDTVHPGGTVIARRPDGDVRWWTWAGHRANATLAATLLPAVSPYRRAHAHWIRLRDDLSRGDWATTLAQAPEGLSLPEIDGRAVRGLKFAEALPARLAEATLAARTVDEAGARATLEEPVRFTNLQSEP
ncbi:hypothetical protein [Streptomyces sp. B93]|uniref:hypothetical protein n=1 Tax=Streptomyces sp. B93 TaxID=2824875 RepID=UPI001B36615B|nr:hypothetical protein [Streptomyces sp. B93]MBQ1091710.1 hypothetical protein [Streptomyces sp. B93]